MLIGLVGKKTCGKDTFANFLVKDYFFHKYAFANPLKDVCKSLFLLSDDQMSNQDEKEKQDTRWKLSPRQMFQLIGTDIVRNQIDQEFWIKHFKLWYESNSKSYEHIIVTDCRFQNEIDAVKEFGGIIIKIVRDDTFVDSHISEAGIDNLTNIDKVIFNNNTKQDFYQRICEYLYETKLI